MKTFSVQEVALLLNVSTETVRRWIRDGKLKAVQHSRKEGNIISEGALDIFLDTYPKYASIASSSKTGVALAVAPMLASMLAKQYLNVKRRKDAQISVKDIIKMVQNEIEVRIQAIQQLEDQEKKLQERIIAENKQVSELNKVLSELDKENA